jgi:hypothetical protein
MADQTSVSPVLTIEGAWRRWMVQLAQTNVTTISEQATVLNQIRRMWAGS